MTSLDKLAARRQRLIPNGVPRYIRVYDNGGKTADRYCVVFTGNYPNRYRGWTDYLCMNAHPTHPQGIGMMGQAQGQIDYPRYSHLGKKITFNDLPEECRKLVLADYREMWNISRDCTDPRHNPNNPCPYDGCGACQLECAPPSA